VNVAARLESRRRDHLRRWSERRCAP
jgi:hypothetical protein